MPQGKGTYGTKIGRPAVTKTTKNRKAKTKAKNKKRV